MAEPSDLLQVSARLLAVGLLIRTVETLCLWREFRQGGMLASRTPWRSGRATHRIDALLSSATLTIILLLLRAGTATVLLVVPAEDAVARGSAIVLFVTAVLENRRFVTLRSAADVMSVVAQGGVAAAALDDGTGLLRSVGLTFIGLQATTAYLGAAVTKLRSVVWHSGVAIERVFEAGRFHRSSMATFLTRHPAASSLIGWGTTLIELLLGVAWLLPTPLMLAVLTGGGLFHLSVALLMRLYPFFWAFVGTYPALYFLHTLIYR